MQANSQSVLGSDEYWPKEQEEKRAARKSCSFAGFNPSDASGISPAPGPMITNLNLPFVATAGACATCVTMRTFVFPSSSLALLT